MSEYQLGICQNCGQTLSKEELLAGKYFCSDKCLQIARLVRYQRNRIKDGTYHNLDIQEAIEIRLQMVLQDGYPASERRVSPEMRAFIRARDKDTCQLCNRHLDEPEIQIDHISGSSNTPDNLRVLCRRCNLDRVWSGPTRPMTKEEMALVQEIRSRAFAKEPVKLCDNEILWNQLYRKIASENKALGRSR